MLSGFGRRGRLRWLACLLLPAAGKHVPRLGPRSETSKRLAGGARALRCWVLEERSALLPSSFFLLLPVEGGACIFKCEHEDHFPAVCCRGDFQAKDLEIQKKTEITRRKKSCLLAGGSGTQSQASPGLTHYQPCHEEDSTVESNCPGSSGPGLAPRLGLASRGRASSRNVELNSHGGQRLGLDDERVDLSGEREGEGEGKGGRGGAGSLWHGWLFAGVFLLRLPRQFAVLVLAFERAPGPFGLGACEQHLFRARIGRSVCDMFNLGPASHALSAERQRTVTMSNAMEHPPKKMAGDMCFLFFALRLDTILSCVLTRAGWPARGRPLYRVVRVCLTFCARTCLRWYRPPLDPSWRTSWCSAYVLL